MDEATSIITRERKPRRMAREPKFEAATAEDTSKAAPHSNSLSSADDIQTVKPISKTRMLLGLLSCGEGASLDQMVAATGWLPHTTRAALTGLRKKGHTLVSEKAGAEPRIYRIADVAGEEA